MPLKPPEHRLKSVFPPGFDKLPSSSSSHSGHYSYTPEQLSHALIDSYNPLSRPDTIIVKSVWYGKQEDSAEHEFIVAKVEDTSVNGLINFMVLDRNVHVAEAPAKAIGQSRVSLQGGKAIDMFRVSYDGDVNQLLTECKLDSHRYLEQIDFTPGHPLYLYELVTLAQDISSRHPYYKALDANCYLFAGLAWSCLRRMRPEAIHKKSQGLEGEKGRFGRVRYIPKDSQVNEIYRAVSGELQRVETTIANQKQLVEKLVQTRLAEMGVVLAALGQPSSGSS